PMESSYMLDVNQSVSDFLSMMPAAKLIWGVPYYGRTWHTTSSALNAATVAGASGYSKAYYYTGAKSLAAAHGRRWDSVGQVPWFVYYDSTARSWIEGYYDDVASLGVKYDMINRRGLAGVGVWHLVMPTSSGSRRAIGSAIPSPGAQPHRTPAAAWWSGASDRWWPTCSTFVPQPVLRSTASHSLSRATGSPSSPVRSPRPDTSGTRCSSASGNGRARTIPGRGGWPHVMRQAHSWCLRSLRP